MDSEAARNLLAFLRTSYPICLLLLSTLTSLSYTILTANKGREGENQNRGSVGRTLSIQIRNPATYCRMNEIPCISGRYFICLSVILVVFYLADMMIYIMRVVNGWSEHWWGGSSIVIYLVGCFFIYANSLLSLLDNKGPKIHQFVCWVCAGPIEIAIFSTSLCLYTSPHHEPVIGDPKGGPLRLRITIWEYMEVASSGLRILILLALILLYTSNEISLRRKEVTTNNDFTTSTETTGLLSARSDSNNSNEYNSMNGIADVELQKPIPLAPAPAESWMGYLSDYSLLLPYMWPFKSVRLQILVIVCFILVVIQRIVNVLVPAQLGAIVTALTIQQERNKVDFPWLKVFVFIFYRWLQKNLGTLRSALWIPMSDYSYVELSTATFAHVHCLSFDFHLNKQTGEIISALNNGHSVTGFLEQMVFAFIPTVFDLIIATGYFVVMFDIYHALVVGLFSYTYFALTTSMAQWRVKSNREMTNALRHEQAIKNESISSYELVQHFNAVSHELRRYSTAVRDFLRSRVDSLLRGFFLSIAQSSNFEICVLFACLIAAYQVSAGMRPVGHFMSVLTYTGQLKSPLSYFGEFYPSIQSAMINAERMLELMKTQPTIRDSSDSVSIPVCMGKIEFKDVFFAYDKRQPVLKGVTFTCEQGDTVALVGQSGGGKSTIIQLLCRFFDVDDGEIRIDGKNIQNVKIESLRNHMSVVSQDPFLWNESIEYNLRYAKPNATFEELTKACKDANIHDTIMGYSDGYKTIVGDRGKRLSGGEKQRIAIARVFLRNSPILLLDEATAALDSTTEERVQQSLKRLSHGRTMIVIAHRLGTVMSANRILVLEKGRVAESGTHQDLLARRGLYCKLWQTQSGI